MGRREMWTVSLAWEAPGDDGGNMVLFLFCHNDPLDIQMVARELVIIMLCDCKVFVYKCMFLFTVQGQGKWCCPKKKRRLLK